MRKVKQEQIKAVNRLLEQLDTKSIAIVKIMAEVLKDWKDMSQTGEQDETAGKR